MRRRSRIGLLAVLGCLAVSSFGSTASAEAACSVTPNYPILSYQGNSQWFVYPYAYISGCTNRNNHIQLQLAEETSAGHWVFHAVMHLYGPETGNHAGWRTLVDCKRLVGRGRFATAWRINSGARHRSSLIHKVC